MSVVKFQGVEYPLNSSKSLLSNMLDQGLHIPNSCRAGICQACKVQLVDGEVNSQAQQGLPATQVEAGIFLACCCFPEHDLEVQRLDASKVSHKAEIKSHQMISDDVLQMKLESDYKWHAGQVVNCVKDDEVIRSYSIASTPAEGLMELHIRVYPDGHFSRWAKESLSEGDTLRIEAPIGDCVYDPAYYKQAMVMVATGTGLAPIYGVLKAAKENHHQGDIYLYHAAGEVSHFYLSDALEALANEWPNLRLRKVIRRGELPDAAEGVEWFKGNVEEIVKAQHSSLKDHRVYLCGSPEMVTKLKKQSFLSGAKMTDILSDPFESSQDS
jgi:NAD(P)H-flavin reductase/ferredoxin